MKPESADQLKSAERNIALDESVSTADSIQHSHSCDDSNIRLAILIERVIGQDELALASLYELTSPRVYGFVLRITRRPALAEEAVEDTYFQVWRQAIRFDARRGNPMAWLLAMARSRALDIIRRESRFAHDELGNDNDVADLKQQAPDDLLAAARGHKLLHDAMLNLGAQPRQLVALSFFRGLSHEEIADLTKVPLGTVKTQIRRALAALRAALGVVGQHAITSER